MSSLPKRIEETTPRSPEARPLAPKFALYFGCPPAERADVEKRLATAKIHVIWVESSTQALAELSRRNMPVLIDLARGAAALQVARDLRTQRPATVLFAVGDNNRPELTTEAVLSNVADVFGRPVGPQRLARAIDRDLGESSSSRTSVDEGVFSADDLYAQSPAMRELLPAITKAAIMGAGALIVGEPGSGRQAVARAIHAASDGRSGPFVVVDCSAFSPQQLANELFGAGSEEGAKGPERVSQTSRLFEARGGTLFLKHISEAPTRVQTRLARLFRDREAVLVETGATTTFEIRPMMSAEPRIDADLAEEHIREDLFRRVSAIRVNVPPLRSRKEDIPALANRFIRDARRGMPPKMLSRSAMALITALQWNGNVAELKKLVATIASVENGNRIVMEDILMHVRLDGGAPIFSGDGTLRQARARFEREYIAAMLRQHRGRITEAAKALGIQRPNLYRKIRALNVVRVARRNGAA